MGFNASHCELCGNRADTYVVSAGIQMCEACVRPAERARQAVAGARESRRYPGMTNRNRNFMFRQKWLEEHPCVDCGYDDPVALEFDHIEERGPKVANVSTLVHRGASLLELKLEIDKCDVVCANCHRRRTATRRTYVMH